MDGPPSAALPAREREALAELWCAAVRACRTDAAVLAETAVVLSGLGAPTSLVAEASRCSAGQAAAAEACAGLAVRHLGRDLPVRALPGLLGRPTGGGRRPRAVLRRLLVRALRDGVLLAGHLGQVCRWAGATAVDPASREVLAGLAATQTATAAFWCDALAWGLDRRPSLLRVLRRLDLPGESPVRAACRAVRADPAVLADHGWPREHELARLWAAHRAATLARLADGPPARPVAPAPVAAAPGAAPGPGAVRVPGRRRADR